MFSLIYWVLLGRFWLFALCCQFFLPVLLTDPPACLHPHWGRVSVLCRSCACSSRESHCLALSLCRALRVLGDCPPERSALKSQRGETDSQPFAHVTNTLRAKHGLPQDHKIDSGNAVDCAIVLASVGTTHDFQTSDRCKKEELHTVGRCSCGCVHACGGQRSVLAVFLSYSTPCVLIQGLSLI